MAGQGQLQPNPNAGPAILASQNTQTSAELEGGRYLAQEFAKDSVRATFFDRIITAINNIASKVGVSVFGEVAPPPPITYVSAKASGEILHVTLTHTPSLTVTRPIHYFVEISANDPNFTQPHVFHLGASRELITSLPTANDSGVNNVYYVRAFSQYPGSKPSAPTSFGGKPGASAGSAISIQMGGSGQMTLLPSTGSGTASLLGTQGGSGFGKYPASSPPPTYSNKQADSAPAAQSITASPIYLDRIADGPLVYRRILQSHSTTTGVAYNFRGVWVSTTAYVQGDEVVYGPSYWLCLVPNTNSAPATGNSNWQVVGSYSAYEGAWSSTPVYVPGEEVTYQGYFWICTTTNQNSAPSTTNSNWALVGTAAAASGSNIVLDPVFALGDTDWSGTGTITFPTETDPYGNTGQQCCKIIGASPLGVLNGLIQQNALTVGSTVLYSAWVMTGGTGSWSLLSQDGTAIYSFGAPTVWTQITFQYVVPAGLTDPTFSIENTSGTSDYCILYEPSITPVVSLDTQVKDGAVYGRTPLGILGTDGTILNNAQGQNLVYNGDFSIYTPPTGIQSTYASSVRANDGANLCPNGWTQNFEISNIGLNGLLYRYTTQYTGDPGNYELVLQNNAGQVNEFSAVCDAFPVRAGTLYNFSAYIDLNLGLPTGANWYFRTLWYKAGTTDFSRTSATLIEYVDLVVASTDVTPGYFGGQVTAPAGAAFCRIAFYHWGNGSEADTQWNLLAANVRCTSTLDDTPDGATYARTLISGSSGQTISSGSLLFSKSSFVNSQGNVPAVSFASSPFTLSSYFEGSTSASALITWLEAYPVIRSDQSAIEIPVVSTQFPIPASPTVSVPSGSGVLYEFAVGIVYEIQGGYYVCAVSPITSKTGTTGTSTIDSPSSVSGAVGWVPLYGSGILALASTYISGHEITDYIAFGTNWSGNADVTTGCQVYNGSTSLSGWTTTGGGSGFFFFGLAASTTYYFYPAWNTSSGEVVMPGMILTAKNATYAIQQSGDGYVALSNGSVSLTTPSSGGGGATSSSGTAGGGRGLL
jgi:hypothetical protein